MILSVGGAANSSATKVFAIAQTGTLRFSAFASQRTTIQPLPNTNAPEGKTNPGQIVTEPTTAIEAVPLVYSLTDPNGAAFPPSGAGTYDISLATLARYRDAAGLSSRQWTVHFSNPNHSAALSSLTVAANLTGYPEPNLSAPLIMNNTGANAIPLQPGGELTLDLIVNSVGTLHIDAIPSAPAALQLELLSPNGRSLATGTTNMQLPIGLRDLHLILNEGPLCHLRITAPTTPANLKCALTAQMLQTIHLDDAVLQERIDAVLGTSATGNYISADIEFDSTKGVNVVNLTISEPAFTTLDNFGIIDTFEDSNFSSQQKRAAATPNSPAPKRLFMDPGQPYPAFEFSDSSGQIRSFKTQTITATVGGTMITQLTPSIRFTVNFAATVNGSKPSVHVGTAQTVDFPEAPAIALSLCIVCVSGKLQVVVEGASLGFVSNLVDLPDFLTWAKCEPSIVSQINTDFSNFVGSIPASATPQLQSIFTLLMGGLFTFTGVDRAGSASEFTYIPAPEPLPVTPDPSYLPRGLARPSVAPVWTSPNASKIDHIVVLMMENRSFDHVFGYLPLTGGRPDIDGLSETLINSFAAGGQPNLLPSTIFPFDPSHAFDSVKIQMGSDLSGKGPMRGFGLAFLQDYPFLAFAPDAPQRIAQDDPYWYPQRKNFGLDAIMGYHNQLNLPYYSTLVREFMVCDRWYSSHPGPTFPNRFMYLSGHLAHDAFAEPMQDNDISSLRLLREHTIADALTERAVDWKLYESPPDVAMLRMYTRYAFDDTNIRPISEFYTAARAGQLPSVTFLEPNFHVGVNTNDDHPPCDMHNGQTLIQNVYEALTANTAAWNKTLFLICYDEHGGLHDHVYPDIADHVQATGQPAIETRYGVRIPALVISPWIPKGSSSHTIFDHTSILKTIMMRFSPNDPAIMSDRMSWANDFLSLLTLTVPRDLNLENGLNQLDPGHDTPAPVKPGPAIPTHVQPIPATLLTEKFAPVQATIVAPVPAAAPALAITIAPIQAQVVSTALVRQPTLRLNALFTSANGKTDFHEYMGKLSTLVGPPRS